LAGLGWSASARVALQEFARTEPHRTIMRRVRPWARTATFRFWTAPADQLTPGQLWPGQLWPEAERRINAPEGRDGWGGSND